MLDGSTTRPSLLVRLRDSGDDAAWREFEAAYGGLFVRYGRRLGLQLADAEDICQTVLAKLARSLRTFDYDPDRGRFRDYLGRSVRNAISSHFSSHRSEASTVSMGEAVERISGEDHDAAVWHEEWTRHHYRRAMQSLRAVVDHQTLVIFDALISGRSIEDVAVQFSMNPAAIRKTKQRMRDRLQAIIARQIQNEELPYRTANA